MYIPNCDFVNDRFLVARLRLDYIIGGGNVPIQEDMEYRSKNLPGNQVRDFYRVIIKEIVEIGEPTTSRTLEALYWILYAKQPLTERALREAVDAPNTEAILAPCMSFIVLSRGTFQFSHTTTVTEFLAEPSNIEDLGAKWSTPLSITKRCLRYLDSPAFFNNLKLLSPITMIFFGRAILYARNGLAAYTAQYWTQHVRDVESELLSDIKDLSHFKFLASTDRRPLLVRLNAWLDVKLTVLHVAAASGLTRFCELCLEARSRCVALTNIH
jgi:hypothetical protein